MELDDFGGRSALEVCGGRSASYRANSPGWHATQADAVTYGAIGVAKSAQESREHGPWAIGTFPSPDGTSMAVVGEQAYGGAGRADTSQIESVQLVPYVLHQEKASYVFAAELPGNPEDRLILQWLGPRKLQITAPNKSFISVKQPRYEDVEVVVKYDPDDPAERARYLKERGLPPD